YGVFNGSRFRNEVVPRVREFHRSLAPAARHLRLVETV
ncbi:MAG: hypothetical protein J2P49_02265, partial [Methylocapsa sp.]|nr:hypothetical protein [Methylocapsa sp.]